MKLSDLPDDAYFIRLTDNHKAFIHPDGDNYKVVESLEGAAGFRKENAENLIRESKASNLEAIKMTDILKK